MLVVCLGRVRECTYRTSECTSASYLYSCRDAILLELIRAGMRHDILDRACTPRRAVRSLPRTYHHHVNALEVVPETTYILCAEPFKCTNILLAEEFQSQVAERPRLVTAKTRSVDTKNHVTSSDLHERVDNVDVHEQFPEYRTYTPSGWYELDSDLQDNETTYWKYPCQACSPIFIG